MAKRTRAQRQRSGAPTTPVPASTPMRVAVTPPMPRVARPSFWHDFELRWSTWVLFRLIFFGLHAVDAFLQIGHAPRYGAGGFNVQQLPGHWLPDPTRVGMTFTYGTMTILFALIAQGVMVRWLLPIAAVLYGYAYFVSQLDSFQHHYLMWLLLVVLCFVPTQPTSIGADHRSWLRSWALRLLLVQLAIVYVWAAIAKMDGPWLDGTLLMRQVHTSTMRTLIGGIGYRTAAIAVLATELTLATALCNRRLWWLALPLGIALHGGVEMIDLDIGLFSYFMLALYLLLVPAPVAEIVVAGYARLAAHGAAIPSTIRIVVAAVVAMVALVIVVRHPLPLVGVGLAAGGIAVVAVVANRGTRAAVANRLTAIALALGLLAGLTLGTHVAADHFRTWAGSSRRLGLADERAGYQGLLRVEPSSEYAHFYLGQLDVKAGDLDRAIAHFVAGERGAPTRVRCYLAESSAHDASGHRDLARAAIERGQAQVVGSTELADRLRSLTDTGGGGDH
jgi:Vitamin K-dependent gamma-carboxylase